MKKQKLVLKKVTLRDLNETSLDAVAGGYSTTCPVLSCRGTCDARTCSTCAQHTCIKC